MSDNKFIHCPDCGGTDMENTGYENDNGEEDVDSLFCSDCGWEGDRSELVCAEAL
jgi:hypothetical protein